MKSILIITHYFPPHSSVASLRTYAIAKYLIRFGYEVKIITTKKYMFDGEQFNKLPTLDCELFEINYLPKIIHNKFNKTLSNKTPQMVRTRNSKLYHLKMFVRKIRKIIGSLIDIHDLFIFPAFKFSLKLYKNWKYDLIISSYSPPAVHIVASLIKRKKPVSWIADYRDLWSLNHSSSSKFPFSILERALENIVIKRADLLITVSEDLKKKLQLMFKGKKINVIENGFDGEFFIKQPKQSSENDTLVISYTGTIYDRQDLSSLLKAVNEIQCENLTYSDKIIINIYGENEVSKNKYADYNFLNFYPKIERNKILEIQKNSDILLFLEWNEIGQTGILTGKLFEYLFSGTPILSIGTYKNNASEIIEYSNCGVFLNNISLIKKYLLDALKNRITYEPNYVYLKQFTRENTIKKMSNLIIEYEL